MRPAARPLLLAAGACAIGGAAAAVAALPQTAAAAQQPAPVATLTAYDCQNLGVTIALRGPQLARARALLPEGFALARPATLLVETSTCARGELGGERLGRFYLSEAALSVRPPRTVRSRQLRELAAENIFMLSQLDTEPRLSQFKQQQGYRTELTSITLELGNPARLRTSARASAGGELAPAQASATLTPALLPRGVRVPNPGIVYKLWTKNAAGQFVVTTNSNLQITQPAVGWGTVRAAPGTLLHGLLGASRASGVAFSGGATKFVNDTYVLQ